MPLQLTITDPLSLTEAERFAILTFCQIRVDTRDPAKIAGATPRNEPRDTVREVLAVAQRDTVVEFKPTPRGEPVALHASTGDPTSRGEVRIDPLDDPSVGVNPAPPVPPAPIVPSGRAFEADAPAVDVRDYASLFGGTPIAAPSVPLPPALAAVPTTLSAAPAAPPVSGLPNLGAASPTIPTVPVAPSAASATTAVSAPSGGASSLPPAAPPNPTNALDSAGMPWDHRIHATTKGKNLDGTWRMKRMKDTPENTKLIADVIEQNRRLMAIPMAPAAPVVQQMPLVPPGADAPPVVPATQPPTGMAFTDLMEQVIRLINGGKLSIEGANAAVLPLGITYLHQLDKRADLIDAAWAHLKAAGGVQ